MALLPVVLVFTLMFCFIQCPKALTIDEYKEIKEEVKNEYIWFNDMDVGQWSLNADNWLEFDRKESGRTFSEQTKEDAREYCDLAAFQMLVRGKCLPRELK